MTPMQAMVAGTLNAAYSLGVDIHLGTLDEGKHADLLVLKKDPRKDVSRVWRSLEKIMLNGAWLT